MFLVCVWRTYFVLKGDDLFNVVWTLTKDPLGSNYGAMIGSLIQAMDKGTTIGSLVRTGAHNWTLGSDQGLPIALNLSYHNPSCLSETLSEQMSQDSGPSSVVS